MAGEDQEEVDPQTAGEPGCSFHRHRDDHSQPEIHASSGPHHDLVSLPCNNNKEVDGQYEIWEHEKSILYEAAQSSAVTADTQCNAEHGNIGAIESMPPPSEWLEETLINLYLTGYSGSIARTDGSANIFLANAVPESEDAHELECDHSSTETIMLDKTVSSSCTIGDKDGVSDKRDSEPIEGVDAIWDEEDWRAQYGQVTESGDFDVLPFPIKNLWDWHMNVQTIGRKRKYREARLVGWLVKKPSKLHPSIPSGGALFTTPPICETRLDVVRVASGHAYRLKNPSVRHLASLSTYDSSNPTKDWGFPDLSVDLPGVFSSSSKESNSSCSETALGSERLVTKRKKKDDHVFRDRAAERRALHGGFGVGPGQKNSS